MGEIFNLQNYRFNIYAVPNFVVAFLFIFLGLFVFYKNQKSPVSRTFLLMAVMAFIWQFVYGIAYLSVNENVANILLRIGYGGVIFIPVVNCHFGASFLKDRKQIMIIYASYVLGAIFFVFLLTTNLFMTGVYKYFWGYYPKVSILHPLYLVTLLGITVYALMSTLWRVYMRARKEKNYVLQNQSKYVFLALLTYWLAAVDFVPNYHIEIYPFGNFFVIGCISILFYTIVRHRLMEIDTVIHKTALWLLTLLLVILPVGLLVTFSMDWIASLGRVAKLALTSVVLIFFVWYYSKLKPYVDHLFRRRKYDYYQVLGEIGQKIGSELDINNVVSRLFKELKDVIYIRNGLVLVQQPGEVNYTEAGSIGYEQFAGEEKPDHIILKYDSSLSQWLQVCQKALEREPVGSDPQYQPIKREASEFLNRNSLELLIPVVMEGKVNALVGIGKKENLQAYTIKDIELLENMGRQIGITIDNAMHHEDIVEKERLAEEMKLGREIQMNLLPRHVPNIQGLTVEGLMQPAKEIGGDYYDFVTLPNKDHLAVVIGDVSGKGVAAGLLMAMAKTAIHTLSQDEASPKQILLRTNTILNQHIGGQKFMTMLYFRWDSESRKLSYSSAGHEHILIYRGGGKVESIQSGGFMLGMIPDISSFLEDRSIMLNPKDKVVLYTDGVTEARNPQEDLFGLPRLTELVSKHGAEPATELLASIKDDVYAYISTREQFDDITLVVMEAQ